MLSRALRIATLATASLSFSLVAGCAADATLEPTSDVSEPDTLVGSTSSALSTFDWSPSVNVGPDAQAAWYGGAMATLNGVTYMVHSGDSSPENLWWTRLDGGQFAVDTQIPNQYASQKVSLAAFNGYLYLFHNGQSDTTAIWVSRFDPATQTWTQNFKLPFTSKYTPAIAAYGGRLRMVGTSPSTNQVWTATLDASETLSPQSYVPNVYSASRLSAAVFANRFYVAHRSSSTTNLAITRFDGTTWALPSVITPGGGAALQGYEAQIAAHDGYLHLVHTRPGSLSVYWTYLNGTSWAPEVTLGTRYSTTPPSLAQGGTGLVLSTTFNYQPSGQALSRRLMFSQYTSPRTSGPILVDPGPILVKP